MTTRTQSQSAKINGSHRAAPKTKPVAQAAAEVVQPAERINNAWFRFQAAGDELLCELKAPSKVRLVAAYVIGLAASFATGFLAASFVEIVMTSVLTLIGSAFLAMMVWVIGLILAVYFGMHAFSAGFGYALSDTCTRHIEAMKRTPARVASFFRRAPKEAA
jgi:hypothetical protein